MLMSADYTYEDAVDGFLPVAILLIEPNGGERYRLLARVDDTGEKVELIRGDDEGELAHFDHRVLPVYADHINRVRVAPRDLFRHAWVYLYDEKISGFRPVYVHHLCQQD
jgi:hypothetical protein